MCRIRSPSPSDSNVAQFLVGKGQCLCGGIFHSVPLVIIRLEIGSEAVCSPVALVTAWARRLS